MNKRMIVFQLLASFAFAKDIAFVKSIEGEVYAIKEQHRQLLHHGDKLSDSMTIETQNGSVTIIFDDGSVMKLAPKSIIELQKYQFHPQKEQFAFELYMSKGECDFESGKISDAAPKKFQFKTPDGVIAIRGTHFLVKVQ